MVMPAGYQQRSPLFGAVVRPYEEGPMRLLNMSLNTIPVVAANVDFVPSNTYALQLPYSVAALDFARVKAVRLLIIGTVKNNFAGDNNIDGAQNIQVNINGGAWNTITTIPDLSLPCGQNATHAINIEEDITSLMTALTNNIGCRWALAKAAQTDFTLTMTVLAKVAWEL